MATADIIELHNACVGFVGYNAPADSSVVDIIFVRSHLVYTWQQLLYPTTADAIGLRLCSLHSTDSLCCQLLAASVSPPGAKTTSARKCIKKLVTRSIIYHRGTARCVVSVEILPIGTQQCRNYLYGKS